jgi:hypothetical protein
MRVILPALAARAATGLPYGGPVPPDPDIEPDAKDWTWVLDRPCPECGYDAESVGLAEVADRLRANAEEWPRLLAASAARDRPDPQTWSPLEYACHVRDVHRVFDGRLAAMLGEDDPLFDNWDQDEAAVEDRYREQQPDAVATELVAAAAAVADRYAGVRREQWQRPGRRSNGSVFTVDTLARYHLHDVEHHLADVRWTRGGSGRLTGG